MSIVYRCVCARALNNECNSNFSFLRWLFVLSHVSSKRESDVGVGEFRSLLSEPGL